MTNDTAKPPLGLSAFGWGALLVAAGALSAAELTQRGLSPLGAAAVPSGALAVLVWFGTRRLATFLEQRVSALTSEVEAGRRKAQAREELLKTIVEASPLALLFYSDGGTILYANAEACQLFFEGRSPVGHNFLNLLAAAPEALRLALLGESDELFSFELAGQHETYHLSRRPLLFEGESHTLLLVRHLTREVSRREIEVLKRVIRVISHELNNSLAPVASLIHSARVIAKSPEHQPKLAQVFDTIDDRTKHLMAFLSGYADLAHTPKPRPALAPWAPLFDQLRTLFPEAKIAEALDTRGFFDTAHLEQLLINLLKNANEAGGRASEVELTITAEADGATTLEISDRGKGLSAEALENAFIPLYSTKERGSGLGLALCREVVEAHDGRLSIANRSGGGCTVTCWLPGRKQSGTELGTSRARLTLTHS